LRHAIEIGKQERVQYIEFRQLGKPLNADLPLATKESFVTLMLELESDPAVHWGNLTSRNRGKVRKALRAGLTTQTGANYLRAFYEIFVRNLRHLGTPAHPIALFENILSVFPDRADILVVKSSTKVISAMFLFKFRDILAEPWVSSLREYHSLYVNNLLYWKAIEYACENDFRIFDFGRSTKGAGTYRFKLQWGARPVPLYYEYFLNLADEIPVVDAVNNQYERYIAVWKKLPLWVTRVIGPRVVKHLPQL
jgi:FemAB-related protein (PEP-CTERM system-associated)